MQHRWVELYAPPGENLGVLHTFEAAQEANQAVSVSHRSYRLDVFHGLKYVSEDDGIICYED
jgi:hypothetical protein